MDRSLLRGRYGKEGGRRGASSAILRTHFVMFGVPKMEGEVDAYPAYFWMRFVMRFIAFC